MTDKNIEHGASILERYLANLSVEVEPFALCMLQSGWRLSLPGPPCPMLHFVVEGEGWLSCPRWRPYGHRAELMTLIPSGTRHSLETCEDFDHELKIDCTPRVRQSITSSPAMTVGRRWSWGAAR